MSDSSSEDNGGTPLNKFKISVHYYNQRGHEVMRNKNKKQRNITKSEIPWFRFSDDIGNKWNDTEETCRFHRIKFRLLYHHEIYP